MLKSLRMNVRGIAILLSFFVALNAAGCRAATPVPAMEATTVSNLTLSAAAFTDGDALPVKNTCDGENKSPALNWSGAPDGTQSLALIADDPDAPMGTFTHWVMYNMPPAQTGLPEGVPQVAQPRGYGTQGLNSYRHTGYDGPCPPRGPRHRYFFKLYALDLPPDLQSGLTAAQLTKAIEGHILGQAQVMGHTQR